MSDKPGEREAPVRAEAAAAQEATASSYDEFPYESYAFAQTHPDRLAVVATLFRMRPAPLEGSRVLELGCASGGNLIPMALTQPAGTLVGLDLSARQIADGQKRVAALGLQNISLRHLSILDVTEEFGLFDYIICHGVYSWVPNAVQDKILEICARNLAPQGVAFVSYNTYPGWHMSGMIRDMLRYHARRFGRAHERVTQARALLNFLAETTAHQQNAYSSLLNEALDVFRKVNNSYLLHEYLEEVNEPVYFHEFVERARSHGLQYLAEAEIHAMLPGRFGTAVASTVEKLSTDFIELEQFLDFVRNRKFRQTLLCHAGIKLQRKVGPEVVAKLFVASSLKPVQADLDICSTAEAQFSSPRGLTPSTSDPLLKSALVHLAAHWPQTVSFAALLDAARARARPGRQQDQSELTRDGQILGKSLLQLYSANLLELHMGKFPFVRNIAEKPLASPLARLQAATVNKVTNLRHESVILSNLDRELLRLLDGSRTRTALLDHLIHLQARGSLTFQQEGEVSRSPESIPKTLSAALERCLAGLAESALFTAG